MEPQIPVNSNAQNPESIDWKGVCSQVLEWIMFVFILWIAMACSLEIVARQEFLTLIKSNIDDYTNECAALSNINPTHTQEINHSTIKTTLDPGFIDLETPTAKTVRIRKYIDNLQDISNGIKALITNGADSKNNTLSVSHDDFRAIRFKSPNEKHILSHPQANNPSESTLSSSPSQAEQLVNQITSFASAAKINQKSSDTLYSFVLILTGGLGALMASMRANAYLNPRKILLGFAAGFVVLLSIKGGKHIFLMYPNAEDLALNPYSGGLFCLLVGLFSEKAYVLLSAAIDHFSIKLEKAIKQ